MDPLNALAKKKNLFVLEDAAQSLGASYGGKEERQPLSPCYYQLLSQ